MTFDEALGYIESLLNLEHAPLAAYATVKLERVRDLLRRLGDPQTRLRSVLVAGTKGKGSTAVMLATILQQAGLRTGLYSKPHLLDYRERIRVDGVLVPHAALASLVEEIRPHVEAMRGSPWGPPTYFEASVAVALLHFLHRRVDLTVLEVGIGGRLDATNAVDPVVSLITPISLDHVEILGATLDAIAREKAGIVRDGRTVVVAPQPPEAMAAIEETCAALGASVIEVGRSVRAEVRQVSPHGQVVTIHGRLRDYPDLALPLLGRHQAVNAATAVAAAEVLEDQGVAIAPSAVRAGLQTVVWPARVELVRERPPVIVDVAHNPASMAALCAALDELFPGRRMVLVIGMVGTHDVRATASLIAPRAASVIATTPDHVHAIPAADLAGHLRAFGREAEVVPDRRAAVERALARAGRDDLVVVTGSFFVVGDAREALLGRERALATS